MSLRTRIKICGITRIEDGIRAAALGVDAIGLVFVARSPRFIVVEQARAVIAQLPPFVTAVGLFMDMPVQDVAKILERVPLGLLQFHGDESPEECDAHNKPYIKAVPMQSPEQALEYVGRYPNAQGYLLDSHGLGKIGGSGECFDWSAIPQGFSKPLILAGGLTTGNVCDAVRRVRPYAVDVSSGVEESKGIKDASLMAAFVKGVREGDSER